MEEKSTKIVEYAIQNKFLKLNNNEDYWYRNYWGGPRTNKRGSILEGMLAALDFRVLNIGNTPTCVRPQGMSIVDLSLASPALASICRGWRVLDDVESLSDHRRRSELEVEELHEAYRLARNRLRDKIRRAKAESWSELIRDVNRDPWGLPYKLVLGKFRCSSPALSETLSLDVLENLISSLFPEGEKHDPAALWRDWNAFREADAVSVQKGSVLGPLLWNIAFDFVIEMRAKPGCTILCYADDIFVLAEAKTIDEALI
ncbi:hypothetical protein DMN91_006886 [Ooceraea biroi]|uniref:Endonuclease/exonuclease/phosphatase domain-containing protein n=1 Tax=Ooceraea biroi TaxID=2015173 RepID=A0A3L8DK48_OOCBI|nr:hypothetical protein DMN91_006886 [Ooceraea biroi]